MVLFVYHDAHDLFFVKNKRLVSGVHRMLRAHEMPFNEKLLIYFTCVFHVQKQGIFHELAF